MLDSFSQFQARNDLILVGQTLRRDHYGNVLAHGLFGRVTEKLFSGSVPAFNRAVE